MSTEPSPDPAHSCSKVVNLFYSSRADLSDIPLTGPDEDDLLMAAASYKIDKGKQNMPSSTYMKL